MILISSLAAFYPCHHEGWPHCFCSCVMMRCVPPIGGYYNARSTLSEEAINSPPRLNVGRPSQLLLLPFFPFIMSPSHDTAASNLESCLSRLEIINQSSFNNDGERTKALRAAYALVGRLESPWETVCRLVTGEVKTP